MHGGGRVDARVSGMWESQIHSFMRSPQSPHRTEDENDRNNDENDALLQFVIMKLVLVLFFKCTGEEVWTR
jgi:hypothetical protein